MNQELALSIVLVICVVIPTLIPFALSRRKAQEEMDINPIYQTLCSKHFFGQGMSIPMSRLSIYESFLVICFITPIVIPLVNITRTEVCGMFPCRYLLIETNYKLTYKLNVWNPKYVIKLLNHN